MAGGNWAAAYSERAREGWWILLFIGLLGAGGLEVECVLVYGSAGVCPEY